MRALVLVSVLAACGGKTMLTEGTDGASGVETPDPKVTPKPKPTTEPEPVPDPPVACVPPIPWTNDFGIIDVSRLGCECASHDDCDAGELCMTFPSIETAHCARTKDPCSLIACRGTATCIIADTDPMLPQCYR